jgi:heat shock protein HslJ
MLRMLLPFIAVAMVELMALGTPAAADAAEKLAGSEWGVPGEDKPYLQFTSGGKVAGSSGCNRFGGSYETADDGSISIGPLFSTKMACEEPVMSKEMQFLEMLQGAKRFERNGTRLALLDQSGKVIGELVQRDAD